MLKKVLFICVAVFVALALCQNENDIINSIYTTPTIKISNHISDNDLPPGVPEQDNCLRGEECVQYYHCLNGTNNYDGFELFDVRFNADIPLKCHDYMKVCCKSNKIDNSFREKTHPSIRSKNVGCGLRNPSGLGININLKNTDAYLAEFPWMIVILAKGSINDREIKIYQCGGSLIHPRVVLTAAHCVDKENALQFIARAGEWDTQTKDEIFGTQDRNISQIKIHQDYNNRSLHNDIALIYLASPFVLTDNVQTICLPPQDFNFNFNRCIASGWGKNMFGREGRYQVLMKKIELPVLNNMQCQSFLRRTRLGTHFKLHNSFMCAGGEPGIDTCTGDGGSPLICPIFGVENRYYQAGIVAWGIGCGAHQIPGVYGNVAKFRNWIDYVFAANDIEVSYYTNEQYDDTY